MKSTSYFYIFLKKAAAFPVLILEKNNVYYFSQQILTNINYKEDNVCKSHLNQFEKYIS